MNSKEKIDHDASKSAKLLTKDPVEIEKKFDEPIKNLLRKYSHIPEERVVEHVLKLVNVDGYREPAFNGLHIVVYETTGLER